LSLIVLSHFLRVDLRSPTAFSPSTFCPVKSLVCSQVALMLVADSIHLFLFSLKNVLCAHQIFPLASFTIRTFTAASFMTKTFVAAARRIPGMPMNLGHVLVCGRPIGESFWARFSKETCEVKRLKAV
jgi:hypothetical protein